MSGACLVAYSICRQCTSVFPSTLRCPSCDGDRAAAAFVAAATASAVEPLRATFATAPRRRRLMAPLIAVSAIMLSVGIGLGWLVAADTEGSPLLASRATATDTP